MQPRSTEYRLTMLEEQMQALRDLPARVAGVESQILQLRTEMRDAISAIRTDLRAEIHGTVGGLRTELHDIRDALRGEIHGIRDELRGEMHGIRDELRGEMHGIRNELRGEMHAIRDALSDDIKIGVEETQRLITLYYEDTRGQFAELHRLLSKGDGPS